MTVSFASLKSIRALTGKAMRELPLSGGPENALADWVVIQAFMRWPENEPEARNYIAAMTHLPHDAGDLAQRVKAAVDEIPMSGRCAGGMLFWMLSFAVHEPQLKVTVNKSSFLVTQMMKGQRFHGERAPRNVGSVKRHWKHLKNAAHLWAALDLTRAALDFDYSALPASYADKAAVHRFLVWFLCTAEQAASVAIEHKLIVGWNPWRVPSSFPRTDPAQIPPPGAGAMQWIRSYRAPW